MTLEEKREAIIGHCSRIVNCTTCPLNDCKGHCYSDDDTVDEHYEILFPTRTPTATLTTTSDNVNHPSHYNREGAMECIEEMKLIFGIEAVKHFCLCNAWKYRYRAADKNGEEDLRKSDEYMRIYKELSDVNE